MISLTIAEARTWRMRSLLLDRRASRSPARVVEWFGAMQAQDLASGEWSFGARSTVLTQAEVHQATVDRQILRTWPMRGTVHFVPPRDAKWMLEVTGVRALAGARKRREYLGLTDAIVNRAVEVLESALRGGGCLTRAACVELLVAAGLHTAPEHGYHLLWYASQLGVTCIGPQQGKDQTFVLLDEWVPNPHRLDRDEALAELAVRYFRGHGPTTRQDFAGWTGLAAGDAKRGIELAGERLVSVDVVIGADVVAMVAAPTTFEEWSGEPVADGSAGEPVRADELLVVPGFDEYMLGFKDRSMMISVEQMAQVIPGANGVFRPTIVMNGRVIGTWKREIKKARVDIRAAPFAPLTSTERAAFHAAGDRYAAYLGLPANYAAN